MGQRRQVLLELRGVQPLQRLAHPAVKLDAAPPGEGHVPRLPHQRVREEKGPRRVRPLHQKARVLRLLQRLEERVLRELANLGEDCQGRLLANHRCRFEKPAARIRQATDPLGHRPADARRNRQALEGCGVEARQLQIARLEKPCYLAHEEGVATRPGVHCLDQLGQHLDLRRIRQEATDLRAREPAQPDSRLRLGESSQVREHLLEGLEARRPHVPVGADDQQAHPPPLARQESQQADGGLVRPVQIVQHQGQGALLTRTLQEGGHAVKESKARLLRGQG
jgi:hypothetical protein